MCSPSLCVLGCACVDDHCCTTTLLLHWTDQEGLLLTARQTLADVNTHHHHHHRYTYQYTLTHRLRHDGLQICCCNTSAFAATIDPHATSCTSPAPTEPFVLSTYQQASVDATKKTHPFSLEVSQQELSSLETHKLIKLIKVEDFKKHLFNNGKHCMALEEVLELCKRTGTATTDAEAEEIAKALDDAGFFLIFRKRVFLEPKTVGDVLSRVMPLPLAVKEDPRNREYAKLLKEKDEIDQIARKQVRSMLWGALGALSAQSMLFFRLTFWDLSWDVMEPICFFVTSSSLLAGFFFFVITKRDPSYHDCMDALFSSKQRKLIKKKNFDLKRFQELQIMCCFPSNQESSDHQQISHT